MFFTPYYNEQVLNEVKYDIQRKDQYITRWQNCLENIYSDDRSYKRCSEMICNDTSTITTNSNNNNNTAQIQHSTIKPCKQLPEKAVRLMNAWYTTHEDNPYPNRNDLDYLATNGGIKESQVKAWFSNKRNRTQNTHPKRAKRYLVRSQTQQNSTLWNEPEKIHVADDFEQRTHLLQQQEQQQEQHSYSNSQLSSIPPTNWPWLPSTSYDYYFHY